jgi:hypothetical protein
MTPHVNRYSGIRYGYYFFYPFYKYSWISNATRTRTCGYRLISESVPNGFFTCEHKDNGYPLPSLGRLACSSVTRRLAIWLCMELMINGGYDTIISRRIIESCSLIASCSVICTCSIDSVCRFQSTSSCLIWN